MDVLELRNFESLSPFEIKDELINLAKKTSRTTQSAFLNAGRGNPNWIATTPREGYFLLGQFAITESKRVMDHPAGIGGMPKPQGIAGRLESWLTKHSDSPGAAFPEGNGAFHREEIRVRTRRVCSRACGLHHWGQLPGSRSDAGSQRTHHARISHVGDVRRSTTIRQVRSLRGGGWDRRDVLHLQVFKSQSFAPTPATRLPSAHPSSRHTPR